MAQLSTMLISGHMKLLTAFGFSIILLLFVATSCEKPNTSLTASEKETIIQTTRQTLNNYYNDIKQDGLLAELKYLDNSSDFFWVPPGYTTSISYDSVITILKQNAPAFKSIVNTWDTLRIIPITKELATYTGRLHSSMTDTSGAVSEFKLVETGILIKRKDGWKLLSGQTSIMN